MNRAAFVHCVIVLATSACSAPAPPRDAAAQDATLDATQDATLDVVRARADAASDADADVESAAPDCGFCGGAFPCPGGHHADCLGGLGCAPGGVPYASVHAPFYTCTLEEARQRLAEGICCGTFFPTSLRGPCPGGCNFGNVEARYQRCGMPTTATPGITWLVRTLCNQRPQLGTPCTTEEECHPAPDRPDDNLRCDRGQCVLAPRPDAPVGFGESCGIAEATLVAGVIVRAVPCLVRGAPGCYTQQQTKSCVVDEHCPAGWDCALRLPCEGYCVPRGSGRDLDHLPSSCPATDAGVDGR